MSKRILTDKNGSEITLWNKDKINLYDAKTYERTKQYAVIIAEDNRFEGL